MNSLKKDLNILNISIIIGSIVIFFHIYGNKIINPTNIDWLIEDDDITQHYLGWEAYRKSKFFFPIGKFNILTYPYETSIMYTDSIPIFAIFLKFFNFLLPNQFQYIGLWGLLSYILQGYFSKIILEIFIENQILIFISSLFFVLSPVLLQRMFFHTALASHWLILFGLYIFYDKNYSFKKYLFLWNSIGFLSPMIHGYLFGINGAIIIFFCFKHLINGQNKNEIFFIFFCYISIFFFTFSFILGGFSNRYSEMSSMGLGQYNFNLNSFYNSIGYSKFLKPFRITILQGDETFNYLGLGSLFLLFISFNFLILYENKKNIQKNWKFLFPIFLMLICSLLFAISPRFTLNKKQLFVINFPKFIKKIWSIFRSTGRFGWICVYNFYILSFITINKYSPNKIFTFLIFFSGFFFQFIDLNNKFYEKKLKYNKYYKTSIKLKDLNKWESLFKMKEIKHFYFGCFLQRDISFQFARLALINNKTLNRFYLVHFKTREFEKDFNKTIKNPQKDSIYIYNNENDKYLPVFKRDIYNFSFYQINEYIISFQNKLSFLNEYYPEKFELNENITLNSNDIYYSPYLQIHFGTYKILLKGQNLNEIEIKLHSNQKKKEYNYDFDYKKEEVNIYLNIDRNTKDFEIIIKNNSSFKKVISKINVQPTVLCYGNNCICRNYKDAEKYFSNICTFRIFNI